MTKIDDHIRSFGMSGLLVTEDIRNLEQRFNIALGHCSSTLDKDDSGYYPQFEGAIRAEASKMSQHYELFYCLETSIRKLISDMLLDVEGIDWWMSKRIPEKIRNDVQSRIQKEIDNGITRRSDYEINYTTFGELAVIITNNWAIFETIFNSVRAVERVMSSLNLLRGPIAHCSPLSDDEVDRLHLTVKDWFRMMS